MGPQARITAAPAGAPVVLKAVKEVQPVYPEAASRVNAQGTVVLEGTVDESGKVTAAKILRSVRPDLDRAAEKAVKEWVFAPVVVEGKPQPAEVIFSARFWINLAPSAVKGGVSGGVEGGVVGGVMGGVVGSVEPPVRAEGAVPPPKIVKQVDPVYPEVARQARAEGVVILELTTDIYGRVMNAKILRSIPLLDQAALDAVRQWVYEPPVIDGRPRSCVFAATVRFVLN
ncbi:MAG: energy transducer TonB [Candidatus Aminicenantes bacterium]|nr:energy transducer TonB [Candidatus Aminicenantes bacterium]